MAFRAHKSEDLPTTTPKHTAWYRLRCLRGEDGW